MEYSTRSHRRSLQSAGGGTAHNGRHVRAHDGQDLTGLTEAAQATIASAEAERDKAVKSAADANAELDQLHRKQGGLKSRAEMESALARMRNLLPDYVVAVLAGF